MFDKDELADKFRGVYDESPTFGTFGTLTGNNYSRLDELDARQVEEQIGYYPEASGVATNATTATAEGSLALAETLQETQRAILRIAFVIESEHKIWTWEVLASAAY